jgi:hypothetical protein
MFDFAASRLRVKPDLRLNLTRSREELFFPLHHIPTTSKGIQATFRTAYYPFHTAYRSDYAVDSPF